MLVSKLLGRGPLGQQRRKLEGSSIMHLGEIGCENVNWM
jgi:hypothetical protein